MHLGHPMMLYGSKAMLAEQITHQQFRRMLKHDAVALCFTLSAQVETHSSKSTNNTLIEDV